MTVAQQRACQVCGAAIHDGPTQADRERYVCFLCGGEECIAVIAKEHGLDHALPTKLRKPTVSFICGAVQMVDGKLAGGICVLTRAHSAACMFASDDEAAYAEALLRIRATDHEWERAGDGLTPETSFRDRCKHCTVEVPAGHGSPNQCVRQRLHQPLFDSLVREYGHKDVGAGKPLFSVGYPAPVTVAPADLVRDRTYLTVKPLQRPSLHGTVPMCSRMVCPSFAYRPKRDGGGAWCNVTNAEPADLCIPAVRDMADDLAAERERSVAQDARAKVLRAAIRSVAREAWFAACVQTFNFGPAAAGLKFTAWFETQDRDHAKHIEPPTTDEIASLKEIADYFDDGYTCPNCGEEDKERTCEPCRVCGCELPSKRLGILYIDRLTSVKP